VSTKRQGQKELATATLTIRLPPTIKERITKAAADSDRTLSLWVIRAFKRELARCEEAFDRDGEWP
jgi:hypothetical protein